jgi:hypothetical protein
VTATSPNKAIFKVVAGRVKLVSAWTVILPFILKMMLRRNKKTNKILPKYAGAQNPGLPDAKYGTDLAAI